MKLERAPATQRIRIFGGAAKQVASIFMRIDSRGKIAETVEAKGRFFPSTASPLRKKEN